MFSNETTHERKEQQKHDFMTQEKQPENQSIVEMRTPCKFHICTIFICGRTLANCQLCRQLSSSANRRLWRRPTMTTTEHIVLLSLFVEFYGSRLLSSGFSKKSFCWYFFVFLCICCRRLCNFSYTYIQFVLTQCTAMEMQMSVMGGGFL